MGEGGAEGTVHVSDLGADLPLVLSGRSLDHVHTLLVDLVVQSALQVEGLSTRAPHHTRRLVLTGTATVPFYLIR